MAGEPTSSAGLCGVGPEGRTKRPSASSDASTRCSGATLLSRWYDRPWSLRTRSFMWIDGRRRLASMTSVRWPAWAKLVARFVMVTLLPALAPTEEIANVWCVRPLVARIVSF